jgi:hypothetical protein
MISKKTSHIFIFVLFILSIQILSTQTPLTIKKINKSITFDGLPFEAVWEDVEPYIMIQMQPVFGDKPSELTEARIFYNDQYLFVSGRMYDSEPSKIQYNTKKRDNLSPNSDGFGIILDTFNDNENALSFSTTPMGLRSDMSIFNDANGSQERMPFNQSWNAFWDVKTVINEQGWFAEIRIPISSLRFQDNNGIVTMGMTIWRWLPHKNEAMAFPPVDPKYGDWAMMKPSKARKIIFEDLRSKKPLYIAPYALAGISQNNDLNDDETEYIYNSKPALEAGLDVKYGLSSNLTLDFTLNTDFAQVEADDQQVNL